jgi:Cupin superfamily protein
MAAVSVPKGQSFEEARLNFHEVQAALLKGTVIFNSAGAHIPKLAGPSLACTDALSFPNALNMYVTAPGMRTSAPPHTDKQDVIVVQTSGKKHWRVYSPPNPAQKPLSDMFSRGKGEDNLPLYSIESEFECELLLEATLNAGDVLFVPAAFPHTTDTLNVDNDETSIHLTFGIDTHIWGLDYVSVRKWALKRCQVPDTKLGGKDHEGNHYAGPVNELPYDQILDIMDALPFGFLDDGAGENEVDSVCSKLEKISEAVDETSYSMVPKNVWKETAVKVQEYGKELLDIHRDMYLAAVEEGRNREAENAILSHIPSHNRKGLTPDQMQRLSVFRVKRYFDKIESSTKVLSDWSCSGIASEAVASEKDILPENWAFTLPVKVGDVVDADLGGAYFPATITRASEGSYDVLYFDGDKEHNLDRSRIRLMNPPIMENNVDTSSMTPKQLKRWKKEQQQKNFSH